VTNARKKALVVCPGRGTYNKTELGYLRRLHADKAPLLAMVDAHRARAGQITISELDSRDVYNLDLHSRGDNAAALIYTCSLADFLSIDAGAFDIVAVTGNSMGWYTALACASSLVPAQGLNVANTMGSLLHEAHVGAQVLHTCVDEDWRVIPGRRAELIALMQSVCTEAGEISISIELGGMLVFAGTEAAVAAFTQRAPVGPGRFPMRLHNHAAFHNSLQTPVSERAKRILPMDGFMQPRVPLIDGRGHIWRPHATDTDALWDYTLGTQVTEAYDFTTAIQVAVREFAPDCLIVLGPGDTLGSSVAQSLIAIGWRGLDSKRAFVALQAQSPYVLAMGREEQRALASGAAHSQRFTLAVSA
jgi:[acyl-carrier-protein] S-malonyltransferase